jgi:hypothetical protein
MDLDRHDVAMTGGGRGATHGAARELFKLCKYGARQRGDCQDRESHS